MRHRMDGRGRLLRLAAVVGTVAVVSFAVGGALAIPSGVPRIGGQFHGSPPVDMLPSTPGADLFGAIARLDLQSPCASSGDSYSIDAAGEAYVQRSGPVDTGGGVMQLPFAIQGLDMDGFAETPDTTFITILPGPDISTGEITEQSAGDGFPATSSMDLSLEIDLGGQSLISDSPVPLDGGVIQGWPPIDWEYRMTGGPIDLYDEGDNLWGCLLGMAFIGANPVDVILKGELLNLEREMFEVSEALADAGLDIGRNGSRLGKALKKLGRIQRTLNRL